MSKTGNYLTQQPLILASGSASRKQLLSLLGLEFEVIPSQCDEDAIKQLFIGQPTELAAQLAQAKGLIVSEQHPEHYVIAADQICVFENIIFDKPGNHQTALKHLTMLAGKTHQQISACCILKAGKMLWEAQDIALLTMRNLTEQALEAYLLHDKPYQSCGAYHYEGMAKWLFEKIQGSSSTIQGLPLGLLINALLALNIVTF